MTRLPSLFISHGAPNIVLSDLPAKNFLQTLAGDLPRPKAIVVISAHFEHDGVAVVADPNPSMIYDFGGFEAELYKMVYAAPGSTELAEKAIGLLGAAGLSPTRIAKRGYDHGTWNPLILAFPKADIPVVVVSVDPAKDARHHYAIGQALAPLADDGVLIIGSGHITHNLGGFFMRGRDAKFDSMMDHVSAAFVEWIHERVEKGDIEALLDWETKAPFAKENHPEAEHFMPFFAALGAGGAKPSGMRLHHSLQSGFFAYDHYAFNIAKAA
ncbi:MAG: DODA-type extradiol aromatic ring-opening family dioxygenase [Notoacmeibacter sp.]